jgi:hypothetical protein
MGECNYLEQQQKQQQKQQQEQQQQQQKKKKNKVTLKCVAIDINYILWV